MSIQLIMFFRPLNYLVYNAWSGPPVSRLLEFPIMNLHMLRKLLYISLSMRRIPYWLVLATRSRRLLVKRWLGNFSAGVIFLLLAYVSPLLPNLNGIHNFFR